MFYLLSILTLNKYTNTQTPNVNILPFCIQALKIAHEHHLIIKIINKNLTFTSYFGNDTQGR